MQVETSSGQTPRATFGHSETMGTDSKRTGKTAAGRIKRTAATVGASVGLVTGNAPTAARSGAVRAVGGLAASGMVARAKGRRLVRSGASGMAAGLGTASDALAGYAENLDWSAIDSTKCLYAGTRGTGRGIEEARLVWESIPEQLRALGPEETARRLDGFDWSHVVAHSEGGGDEAANGTFEVAGLNRSRGAEQMTAAEIEAASKVLRETAFAAALEDVASRMLGAALAGGAMSCVISVLECGLEHQRGDIAREEMHRRMGHDVTRSAGVAASVSGIIASAALAFPALIPLAAPLMMPLAALAIALLAERSSAWGRDGTNCITRFGPGA